MIRKSVWMGVLALAPIAAGAEGHAVGAKAGFLGFGVEYTHDFTDRVSARFGVNGSSIGFDAEESGIEYEFDFEWDSLTAAVDFHPLASPLRLTAGVMSNDNALVGESRVTENVNVGGEIYTPDEVGTLRSVVGFDGTAPFAGLGWDWSRKRRLFGVSFDLGVVSQGSPRVRLSSDGDFADEPVFQDSLAEEQAQLEDELDDLDLVPYATLGFQFRF